MALDIQEQLAILRQRVAKIDARFQNAATRPAERPAPIPYAYPPVERPERYYVEEYLSGEAVQNQHGAHFQTERHYPRHKRHGSMEIGSLAELPCDLFGDLSHNAIPACSPQKWAFLDTETTGLAGGTGTYAFLIGVGRITEDGFRVRQFFMRDYAEEPSLLAGLAEHLAQFDVLVTYNGKAYDQPLLETRYRMARARSPFSRLQHMDLLFGARRLWKLRVQNCRLVNLEHRILGLERTGDLPGEMIPYVYFEFLRTQEAARVVPILHHNVMDIVSLACLSGIVPWAFRTPYHAPHLSQGLQGPDLVGVARWLQTAGRLEHALELFRLATEHKLKDELLFRTCWDIALLEKKLGRTEKALPFLNELITCRNAHRLSALLELAKHFERVEKDALKALEITRQALTLEPTEQWRKRETRLQKRIDRQARRLPVDL